MKLPAVFHEHQNFEHIKQLTSNMTCPESIPKSNHCFLLPIPLKKASLESSLDFRKLSLTGYKSVKLRSMSKILEQKDLEIDIKWYYLNSKTRKVLFYGPIAKHIRYVPRYYYMHCRHHIRKNLICLMLLFFFRLTILKKEI